MLINVSSSSQKDDDFPADKRADFQFLKVAAIVLAILTLLFLAILIHLSKHDPLADPSNLTIEPHAQMWRGGRS